MKTLFSLLLLALPLGLFAQDTLMPPKVGPKAEHNNHSSDDMGVGIPAAPPQDAFTVVDQMPEFPGGQDALMKYLRDNLRYPEDAREMAIQGKVYLRFVVDETGQVTDVRVLRSVNSSLDKESIRVVSRMPPWKPGTLNGKPVKVYYSLPINFKLQ